ncbi:MAG: hypothetical protein IJ451_04195 [Ruminococcus sp.]|nr:hypothetical protein [Ruminococcus sp.]
MRKIASLLIVVVLVGAFAVNTAATGEFKKMKDLNNYWAENDAYPDWFCGVWTETGSLNNLVVSVLDTEEGNNGKQEILDLIEDDTSVTFTYGEYSRNYLIGVQYSFSKETFQELGLSYAAFLDDQNRIELGILKSKRNDPKVNEKLEELKEQYGDIFTVEYTDGIVTTDISLAKDLPSVVYTVEKASPSYFIYVAVAVSFLLSLICLVTIVRQKKRYALQTNEGVTVNVYSKLSVKELEHLIINTDIEIPSSLDVKIMKEIENRN